MAIEIKETFQVRAPMDAVWRFLIDPQQVVTCVPGASLDSAVDERTFLGTVKVKVGAITTSYKGKVQFTERDEQAGVMRMVAHQRSGREQRQTGRPRHQQQADSNKNMTRRDTSNEYRLVGGSYHCACHPFCCSFAANKALPCAGGEAPDGATTNGAGVNF